MFRSHRLWAAVFLPAGLHSLVVYVPFLQFAFGTVALTAMDWVRCLAVSSLVLWCVELAKMLSGIRSPDARLIRQEVAG